MTKLHTVKARLLPSMRREHGEREADLALLSEVGLSEEEAGSAFIFPAEISNNNLDFYYGRMGESTLRNFARDAKSGVSLLDSHNSRNLGYGQSLSGEFHPGEAMRTTAQFFTVRGIHFGGQLTYASTDDFIRAIETGVARDVSVGFYFGEDGGEICDICGHDVWEFDLETFRYVCPHIPGLRYEDAESGESNLATFRVENGRLAEVSVVYDGATPGAAIEKTTRMAEDGLIGPEAIRRLEVQYRFTMPEVRKYWTPDKKSKKGESAMTEKNDKPVVEERLAKIGTMLRDAGVVADTVEDGVKWLISERAKLIPLADQGIAYRADLIEDALAEGVRAMGSDFPAETYRSMLADQPLDSIKTIRDKWAKMASERLRGGRATVDEDETETKPTEPKKRDHVPASAYKV